MAKIDKNALLEKMKSRNVVDNYKPSDVVNIKPSSANSVVQSENFVESEKSNNTTKKLDNNTTIQQNKTNLGKDVDFRTVHCRVSEDFKIAISIYCVKNNIKEKEMEAGVIKNILENKIVKHEVCYDVNNNGKDATKLVVVKVDEKTKINLFILAKTNKLAESYLIAQEIAKVIGWKKTKRS